MSTSRNFQLPPDDGNPLTREVINCNGSFFSGPVQCERETITLTPERVEMSRQLEQVQGWVLLSLSIVMCLVVVSGLVKGYYDGKAISDKDKRVSSPP